MEIFNLTLKQMLLMFTLILLGYIIKKKNIIAENTGITLAKLETFVFTPALSLYTQMTKCTVKTFTENSALISYGLIIVLAAIALSYPLSKLFVKDSNKSPELEYQRNIYKYALTFSNYGFVGNFIILGVWGNDFFYKYSLFVFMVGILCNSWGLFVLIPKEHGASLWSNIKKSICTPPLIALLIGMAIGLLGLTKFVPQFFIDACDNAGKCQGPVAMLLAGIVIGGYNIKELITNKKVYVASFLRLVAIPGVMMLVLKALGAGDELMTLALVAFASPLGLNTIVYPAAFGGETKTGAAMTMISQTFSVITLPLMYLVFIVLM